MKKEQLIEIAKAGFPDRVKQFIDFKNCKMCHCGGVYRLYDKDEKFILTCPEHDHIAIFMDEDNFIQITTGIKAFNHYAAIKKMEELKLV